MHHDGQRERTGTGIRRVFRLRSFDVGVPVLGDPGPPLFGDAADDPADVVEAPPEDAESW